MQKRWVKMIQIDRLNNGYLITDFNVDEDMIPTKTAVIVEGNDDLESNRQIVDLIYHLLESLGIFFSKHNKYRVKIVITKDDEIIEE